jgi:hypothetical protein
VNNFLVTIVSVYCMQLFFVIFGFTVESIIDDPTLFKSKKSVLFALIPFCFIWIAAKHIFNHFKQLD